MLEYMEINDISFEIILIILALILSAFFSSSETALTSLTFVKTKELIEKHKKTAKYLKLWLKNPAKVLTTILIGNNIANILASSLMTVISEKLFSNNAIAISVGIMTFLILTFSEIMPKIFARIYNEKISLISIRFLAVFYYILYPLNYFFIDILTKLFRVDIDIKGHPVITIKDIDSLINIADAEGTLEDSPKASYLKAMTDFSESKVRSVMIPENQIVSINVNTDIDSVIKIVQEDMHSRYPIINDKDEFVGILHVKDLLIHINELKESKSFTNILRPSLFINEYMKIDEVLEMMKRKKTQMFLVKDEFDEISGLITMEDIIEELIGEIEDEHDDEENNIKKVDSNTIIVSGTESIHDLNVKYDFEFPEDKDFTTINGFLLSILDGHLPKKDAVVKWENISLKILKKANKHIEEVEVKILDDLEVENDNI